MKKAEIQEAGAKMDKAIDAFDRDLGRVRTGRASAAILEGINVDYYGTSMPLNQVASVAVPESRLLSIQPWDIKILVDIEKAILKSDLGLTPSNDGKIIRVNVPPLTEERRKELVKLVKKMAEDCRVAMRNVRREAIERLKGRKKAKEISEDDLFRLQDEVQEITDDHIKKVEGIIADKEKEILEF
ncbi:MAG: ribosome recycling factor [Deltaproteobacteria bacterium]|nr:ribosome recycling factor [Deltaproteobacteria bacterium]MBW1718657.1 ribosome recycling factor [Deltaproteobacteria bacterium]MBW1932000.1 ribosome recycling factor [Deltaproteobacteria bacterium]MBW1937749.1 ribosome recycling factor [Deltaproteobacteria bacterium]MBW1964406.1 ribosome recycling factor [Deltaproteobacteria bacterium]